MLLAGENVRYMLRGRPLRRRRRFVRVAQAGIPRLSYPSLLLSRVFLLLPRDAWILDSRGSFARDNRV
jgi:hypothetical protein